MTIQKVEPAQLEKSIFYEYKYWKHFTNILQQTVKLIGVVNNSQIIQIK